MKTLICDVCKAIITNAEKDRDYFHIANIDVCEHCKDDLDSSVKYTVRGKAPFDYQWYQDLVMQKLNDGMNRGKIVVK